MYELPTYPIADGPFKPDWHSLEQFRVPRWYEDAKFGIFIHWGPYSVPAFQDEWYSRKMYVKGDPAFEHHLKHWGPHDKFGYKDFIPLFKAEKFDASAWAELFKNAGAKYVVPVAEHHDGFAMYDTALNRWNAKNMGPRRDIIGELSAAVRERGMNFGVSNHRAEHWWFMNGGREYPSDVNDAAFADFYGPAESQSVTPTRAFKDDYLARLCELADKYQPDLYYFDTWAERPPISPYLQAFAAHYYNRGHQWNRQVAINFKNHMFDLRTAVPDVERGQMGDIQPYFWQSDTSIGMKSWCHTNDDTYKPADLLLGDLIDIVSKNGTMLLNIGPHADGSIGDEPTRVLNFIGTWLRANGEAIYGTRPWKVFGEGPTAVPEGHFTDSKRVPYVASDYRFTTRGQSTLYAVSLGEAATNHTIRSLGATMKIDSRPITKLSLLSDPSRTVRWAQGESGLHLQSNVPFPPRAAFKIEFAPT